MTKKSKVSKNQMSTVMRAIVNKRWSKTTKQERSEIGRKLVQARWNKRKV